MPLPAVDAELFCRSESLLGEGPFWHDDRLYWVDILQSALRSCDREGGDSKTIDFPSHVGAVAPWGGKLIAGTSQGLGILAPDGSFQLLPQSPPLPPKVRFNDGKLDPAGRFWCGTMEYSAAPNAGALYRVERNGTVSQVLDNITIANGLAWDVATRRFYYIDTVLQRVDVFDYDISSGAIANRRVAFELATEYGLPDGMCLDRAGRLWIAFWRGSQVIAFDAKSGAPRCCVKVPTRLTSSCCLHPDGRKLFITTARTEHTAAQLRDEPLAGSVFCADISAA